MLAVARAAVLAPALLAPGMEGINARAKPELNKKLVDIQDSHWGKTQVSGLQVQQLIQIYTTLTAVCHFLHLDPNHQIPTQLWGIMKVRAGTQSPVWSKEVIDTLVKEVKAGKDISVGDYKGSAADVELALRIQGVKGKSVMVGGSISPWVESIALGLGCEKIITSDYGPADSEHPAIKVSGLPVLQLIQIHKRTHLLRLL